MSVIAIASAAAFLAVVLLMWWIYSAFTRATDEATRSVQTRLDALARRGEAAPYPSLLRDESLSEIPTLDRLLHQSNLARRLDLLLRQADVRMRVGVLLLLILVMAAAPFAIVSWATGHLLLAAAAQAMVAGRSLEGLEEILERTGSGREAAPEQAGARVPRDRAEVVAALVEHRQVLEAGNVFPAECIDREIDLLKRVSGTLFHA